MEGCRGVHPECFCKVRRLADGSEGNAGRLSVDRVGYEASLDSLASRFRLREAVETDVPKNCGAELRLLDLVEFVPSAR